MSLKRSKKQTLAMRRNATRPTHTVTLVKAPPQPVLAPQAHGHRKHGVVHQDAPSTTPIARGLLLPSPVTAPVPSPKGARRDAHGRFLAKKSM